MNVALYNQLVNAKTYLKENSRIDSEIWVAQYKIGCNKNYLDSCKNVREYRKLKKPPFIKKVHNFFTRLAFPENKSFLESCLHFIYVLPIVAFIELMFYVIYAIYYILAYPIIRLSENIKDKKYIKEYEESLATTKEEIACLEKNIIELNEERKTINDKYGYSLSLLYEGYRREEAINCMLQFMRQYPNSFRTLNELQNFLSQHYSNLDEAERRMEEQELREQQHKETQEAVNVIARNQERIAADIERVEREIKEFDRW